MNRKDAFESCEEPYYDNGETQTKWRASVLWYRHCIPSFRKRNIIWWACGYWSVTPVSCLCIGRGTIDDVEQRSSGKCERNHVMRRCWLALFYNSIAINTSAASTASDNNIYSATLTGRLREHWVETTTKMYWLLDSISEHHPISAVWSFQGIPKPPTSMPKATLLRRGSLRKEFELIVFRSLILCLHILSANTTLPISKSRMMGTGFTHSPSIKKERNDPLRAKRVSFKC